MDKHSSKAPITGSCGILSEARQEKRQRRSVRAACPPDRSCPPGRTRSRTPARRYPPPLMQSHPCQTPSRVIRECPSAAWGHRDGPEAHASGSHLGVSLMGLCLISPCAASQEPT